jgi:hypothetical protein
MEEGFGLVWKSKRAPYLISPKGERILCAVYNRCPYLASDLQLAPAACLGPARSPQADGEMMTNSSAETMAPSDDKEQVLTDHDRKGGASCAPNDKGRVDQDTTGGASCPCVWKLRTGCAFAMPRTGDFEEGSNLRTNVGRARRCAPRAGL